MIQKTDIRNIILWGLLFFIYFIFFSASMSVHSMLAHSFLSATWISVIISIVKKEGGSSRFYCYSKQTNQKLRYLVLLVLSIFVIIGHYFLFCNQFELCDI